jgi:peptidoglycan/xylan/chitin deacetylase (PgdA/CDA1 family)
MTKKNSLKIAISALWYVGERIRHALGRLVGHRPAARLIVLYYHGVGADTQDSFARQMQSLSRTATVVPAGHSGPLPSGRPCVGITFDDAFRSLREHAIPELERLSFPFTVFVPVEFMGRPPGWEMESGVVLEEVMTTDELRSLPGLAQLGSHTVTHPHLTRVDDARLEDELETSRRVLADLVASPVELLAFPYGDYDERTVLACRAAGYERVFGIDPRPVDPLGQDFVRGRIAVDPSDGPLVFHLKASGAFAWMTYASALKSKIRARRTRS